MSKNKTILFFTFLILPAVVFLRTKAFICIGGRDTGGFAYIGEMILNGQIPYRDIWDHKTPLLYYLYALIFHIFGSNFKTIVLFDIVWLFISAIFIYKLSNIIFKWKTSLCVSFLFATYISCLEFTGPYGAMETYQVLPVLIAIFAIIKYSQTRKYFFLVASGVMSAAAFLFKQTGAIIVLPILLFLAVNHFIEKRKFFNLFFEYALVIFGALIPLAIFFIYFLINSALNDCLSQIFSYNLVYSQKDSLQGFLSFKPIAAIFMMGDSSLVKIPVLLILGGLGLLYKLFYFLKKSTDKDSVAYLRELALFSMLFFWALIACYSLVFSGRNAGHYLIQLMPPLALFSGYLIELWFKKNRSRLLAAGIMLTFFFYSPLLKASYFYGAAVVVVQKDIFRYFYDKNPLLVSKAMDRAFSYNVAYIKDRRIFLNEEYMVKIGQGRSKQLYIYWKAPVVNWIIKNTTKDDFVYFWGGEAAINFLIKRKNPSKYFYLYPLETEGYTKDSDIRRFIQDLKENKPKFIIDTYLTNPFIPSLKLNNLERTTAFYAPVLLLPAIEFINDNYTYERTIEGWDVYKLKALQ